MTDNEITDWRDNLITKSNYEPLSVTEQNLLRDSDIALGIVQCDPETREEARRRVGLPRLHRRDTAPTVKNPTARITP